MAILGVGLLLPACLFYLYVLVRFHIETVRPRRNERPPRNRVIVIHDIVARPESRIGDSSASQLSFRTAKPTAEAPLPFGMRRLAVKHEARG